MLETLTEFSKEANDNTDVRRVVGAWHVDLLIDASDSDEQWLLEVRKGRVVSVRDRHDAGALDSSQVRVSGKRHILQSVFGGKLNPLLAATQGELEIYGEMANQTRLDAIALILWGP
jgi:hypothetical protein